MRIVVGISGGVDSALAAALLQERGFDVVGCFLKVELSTLNSQLSTCPWREDLPMAHRVAAHLNIPLVVKDVSAEYEREVLEPMVAAYRAGETPNPDTMCNRWVKFDALAAVARTVDAERIATGHYARVCRRSHEYANVHESTNTRIHPLHLSPSRLEGELEGEGFVELHRGLDHVKDQSYFLATLTQKQLVACEFPLGEWRKEDVRVEAKRRGFPNWDRHSTSGVCFIGHVDLAQFLAARTAVTPATVVTTTGEVIGVVPAGEAMTIGQRVPVAGQPVPRYVVATEPAAQRIVVSASMDDPARYTSVIHATAPNWIGASPFVSPPPTGRRSERGWGTVHCSARIRHRQEPQPCT
ncbi:MAG: hypothetical protein Q7R80_04850, partial [bacterium]|nr:hypothetical protein [bacterium]